MLVMNRMNMSLRKYLQQNYERITWKEKIHTLIQITGALEKIHREKANHRDLHSGNILYDKENHEFYIGDLGFCGPVDKPPEQTYGNLPYIAPEVLVGKEYTFKSDIYSIGMLMWEISSGQLPFINYEHDYYLAKNLVNGIRPKIVSGTPLKYKSLMEQCWDADPFKRPDVYTLYDKIKEMNRAYHQDISNENENVIRKVIKNFGLLKLSQQKPDNLGTNNLESFTSKVYHFKDLPEPRNATQGNITYYNTCLTFLYLLIILLLTLCDDIYIYIFLNNRRTRRY